jgi:glucose/arabinose dehydrogenase
MVSTRRGRGQPRLRAPKLADRLASLYAPLHPLAQRIRVPRQGQRRYNPDHLLLPEGFVAEVVAAGFNAPVHCCFDEQGYCYVSEAGHKIESAPRILKVDPSSGVWEPFLELPEERWRQTGALTGACWLNGRLYFTNTDTVSRVGEGGRIEDVVTGLPGLGDHQVNYPVAGSDGKLYFGIGSATNTGVVGADNFAYEWLPDFPEFCDVPGADVVLAGRNYEYPNVLGNPSETVRSGAYVPFGTETTPGQVIKGQVKCTGSVLRCDPDGSNLELLAWGLRNPYGIAFHPDGRPFATEHGIDERSRRHIIDDPDDLYEIRQGSWYGWPDFASGIRLDDPRWGDGGRGREPVLAEHPDPDPPKPVVTFTPHAAANGLDICRDPGFGFEGQAFVALFGDLAPVTVRSVTPAGFKIARVDLERRQVVDFAVNRLGGPASKLPHQGFERPSHCQFGPDGALYVVDWGEIRLAPEVGGIRVAKGTGSLWRIRRTGAARGEEPPRPLLVPAYGIRLLTLGAAGAGALAAALWAARRRR